MAYRWWRRWKKASESMSVLLASLISCLACSPGLAGAVPKLFGADRGFVVNTNGSWYFALRETPAGRTAASSVRRQPAQAAPVPDGTYTAAQAERGKAVYDQSCSACHGASLRGGANEFGAPALAGPFFFEKWRGRPLEELFRYAAENMPPDQRLPDAAAYVDVTAYILQVLKYPARSTELSGDSPLMKRGIEPQP
jgi:quinoprotein glucose dehydrogenase